jgi:microcompartment protein CcmL/EutN
MADRLSLALLEVHYLSPSLMVADACVKTAGVRIVGIESTDGPQQCLKLVGETGAIMAAAERGAELARRMGGQCTVSILPSPREETVSLVNSPPVFSPLLGLYDSRIPKEGVMNTEAVGLLETQGLVAALHATDDMLKSSNVVLAGKEKIGAAYVTIMVRGDVAAVQTAIETGKATVERLGGKLIMADVIARPHPDLAALLPK